MRANQVDDFIWLDEDEGDGSLEELNTGCLIDDVEEPEPEVKQPRVFKKGS